MTIIMDRRQLVAGLAAGSVVAISGCANNAHLGRSQLLLVSNDQLAEMSKLTWTQLNKQEDFLKGTSFNRRVEEVGKRIVDRSGQGNRNWEFHVIDSPQVNAFVLPGGQVAFYSGILDIMDNDAQVATVMGHEIGHVVGQHAAERASQQMAANIGLQLTNIALASQDIAYAGQISSILGAGVSFGVLLPYSRQHEYEADRLGVQYMSQAGYNPYQAVKFWESMSANSKGAPAEFMSTHPSDSNRIKAIQALIPTLRKPA